jgi:hypothetical protein
MAKVDQEAHFGIRLQSVRKALPEGHRQSKETQVLPDQPRLTRLDPSTSDLVRGEVSVNLSIYEPQKQAGGEKQVFDTLWQKEITVLDTGADIEKSDERVKAGITRLRSESLPARIKHGKDLLTLTRVTEPVTQTAKALTPERQEEQGQRDEGNSLIRQRISAMQSERGNREVVFSASNLPEPRQDLSADRQVSRYAARRGELVRLDALPLARVTSSLLSGKTQPGNLLPPESQTRKVAHQLESDGEAHSLGQTMNRHDQITRAEGIILNAIRSKADIDGKNARVAYESLADMTGFSKRHVIRVVKSLIYERGMVRVDKRVLKPGRNAINVYHVDIHRPQEATLSERGSSLPARKIGAKRARPVNLTTRVTDPVTPNSQTTRIPSLRTDRLIPEPKFVAKSHVVRII